MNLPSSMSTPTPASTSNGAGTGAGALFTSRHDRAHDHSSPQQPPTFSQAQMTSNLFQLMDTFGPHDDDFFSTDPDHLSSSDNELVDDADQPGRNPEPGFTAAFHSGSPADVFDTNVPHINLEDNQYLHHQLELSRAERELRELEQAAFTNLPNFLPGVFPGRMGAEQVSPERLKRYGVSASLHDASIMDSMDDALQNNAVGLGARWAAAAGVDADDEMGHEGETSEDQTSPAPAAHARHQPQRVAGTATIASPLRKHRHTASTSSLFSTPNQSTDSRNEAHSLSSPRREPLLETRPLTHSPTNSGNVGDREEDECESSPSSSSTVRSTASGRIMLAPAACTLSPPPSQPAPIKKAATSGKLVTRLDSAMVTEDSASASAKAEVGLGPEVQHHYLSSMVPMSRDMSPMPSLPPSAANEVGAGRDMGRMTAFGSTGQQHGCDASLSAFAHFLAHHPHLHPVPIPTPQAGQTSLTPLTSHAAYHEPTSVNAGFHLSPMVLPAATQPVGPVTPSAPVPVPKPSSHLSHKQLMTKPSSPLSHKQPLTAVRSHVSDAVPPLSPHTRLPRQVPGTPRQRASPERIAPMSAPRSLSSPTSVTSRLSNTLPTVNEPPTSVAYAVLDTSSRLLPLAAWFPSGIMDLRRLYTRLSPTHTTGSSAEPLSHMDRLLPTPAAVLAFLVYASATWSALAASPTSPSQALTTGLASAVRNRVPRVLQTLVLAQLARVTRTLVVLPLMYVLEWIVTLVCMGSMGAVRATAAAGGARVAPKLGCERSATGVLIGMTAMMDETQPRNKARSDKKRKSWSRSSAGRAAGRRKEVTVVEALAAVYRARLAWAAATAASKDGNTDVEVPALVVLVAQVMVVYLVAAAGCLERDCTKQEGEAVSGDHHMVVGGAGRGVWVVDVGLLADLVGGPGRATMDD